MSSERPFIRFTPGHSLPLAVHRWPRPAGMPSVFTAFVRSQQGEETPDADLFRDAWRRLQAVLAGEMRRRGLWQSPPCYLGVYGVDRWDDDALQEDPMARGAQPAGEQVSALGELVADCYAFIFVDRLRGLKRQLMDKPDIDGLVLLNVRHFLHSRQKEHDPVGYRVFEVLRSAVRSCLASGRLHVLGGDERVRNDTVLGFTPAAAPEAAAADLAHLVVRWNDTLLPDLVTGRGRGEEWVGARLRQRLLELREHGIRVFRFKDLIDPLKSDARQRWAALLAVGGAQADGEPREAAAGAAGRESDASAVESRQSLEFLTRCVGAAIRRIEADPQTRGHLAALWQFLRRQTCVGDDTAAGGGGARAGLGGERPPSYRQLGQRLNIPRARIPMLFTTLRQLVVRCRAAARARRSVPVRRRRPPVAPRV
jgi:hypothetical protein